MSEELKPCPFCGAAAFLHENDEYWYVACQGCINQTTHFFEGKNIVIERWNARHESSELADLKAKLDAVRKILDFYRDNVSVLRRDLELGNDVAVEATFTILRLDGGDRAKTALTIIDATPSNSMELDHSENVLTMVEGTTDAD